jgi:hypothetical protein
VLKRLTLKDECGELVDVRLQAGGPETSLGELTGIELTSSSPPALSSSLHRHDHHYHHHRQYHHYEHHYHHHHQVS